MPEKHLIVQESEGAIHRHPQSDKKMNNGKKMSASSQKKERMPEEISLSSLSSKKAFKDLSQPSLLSSTSSLHSTSSRARNADKANKRVSKMLLDEASGDKNTKESHDNYQQDVHNDEVDTPRHCLQKKKNSEKQQACSSSDDSHSSPRSNTNSSTHRECISVTSTSPTSREHEKVNPLVVSSDTCPTFPPLSTTDATSSEKKRERERNHDDGSAYFASCRLPLSAPSSLSSVLFPAVLRLFGWKVYTFLSNCEKDGESALFSFLRHYYCHHFMKEFLPEEAEEKKASFKNNRKIMKLPTTNTMKTHRSTSAVVPEEPKEVVEKEENASALPRRKEVKMIPTSAFHRAAPSFSAPPCPSPLSFREAGREGGTTCTGSDVAFCIVNHVHHVCDVIQGMVSAPSPLLESAVQQSMPFPCTTMHMHAQEEKAEEETRQKMKTENKKRNTERLSSEETKRTRRNDKSPASSFPSFLLFQHVCQPFNQVLCRLSPRPSLSSSPSSFAYLLGEVDWSVPLGFASSLSKKVPLPTPLGPSLFSSTPLSEPLRCPPPPPVFPPSAHPMNAATTSSASPRFLSHEEVVEVFATRAMRGITAGTVMTNTATACHSSSPSVPTFHRMILMDIPYPYLSFLVNDGHAGEPQKQEKEEGIQGTTVATDSTANRTSHTAATTPTTSRATLHTRVAKNRNAIHSAPHHGASDSKRGTLFHVPVSPLSSSSSPPVTLPSVTVEKENRGNVSLSELFFMQEKEEEANQRQAKSTKKVETKSKKGEEGKEVKKEDEEADKRQKNTMAGSVDAVKQQQQQILRGCRSPVTAESHGGRAGENDEVLSENGKDVTKEGKKIQDAPATFPLSTHCSPSSPVSAPTLRSPSLSSPPFRHTPSLGTLKHVSGFTVKDTQSSVSLAYTRHFLRCCADDERKERQYIASRYPLGLSPEAWTTPATIPTLPAPLSPCATPCTSPPSPASRKRSRSSSCSASAVAHPRLNADVQPSSPPVPEEASTAAHKDAGEEEERTVHREREEKTAFHALIGCCFHHQRQRQDEIREAMWKCVQRATHRLTTLQKVHRDRRHGAEKDPWTRPHEVEDEDSDVEEDEEEKKCWKDLARAPLGTLAIADVLYAAVQTQLEANTEERNYYKRHHSLSLSSSLSLPSFPPVPPRAFLTTGGTLATWRRHLFSSSSSTLFPTSLSSSLAAGAVSAPSSPPHALDHPLPPPPHRSHHWREISPSASFLVERLPVLEDIPFRGALIPAPTSAAPFRCTSTSSPSFLDASPVAPRHGGSHFSRPPWISSPLYGVTYAAIPKEPNGGWDTPPCRRRRVGHHGDNAPCMPGPPEEREGSRASHGPVVQMITVRLWGGAASRAEVPPSSAGQANEKKGTKIGPEEEKKTEDTEGISSDRRASLSFVPPFSVVENPEEDVRYFVHRRYMPKSMKEQMDREHTEDAGRSPSSSSPLSSGRSKRYRQREAQKEGKEEEQEERAGVCQTFIDSTGSKKNEEKKDKKESVTPLSTDILSLHLGRTVSSCEEEEVKRQAMSNTEPVLEALKQKGGISILPIPMPDVEWRYH